MRIFALVITLSLQFLTMPVLADPGILLKGVITKLTSSQPLDQFGNPDSGLIWVNSATQSLHVDLYSDPCRSLLPPHNGYIGCFAIAKLTARFVATLESTLPGSCDRVLYRGGESQDVEIGISDNRRFFESCKSYLPMPAVSGFLTLRAAGVLQNEIRFDGIVLENDQDKPTK